MHRRNVLAGAAALAAAPLASRAEIKGDYVAFRFAMRRDQPVTAMTIGKSKPYLMLLDTGNSSAASLKPSICKALDLDRLGSKRLYGATGTNTVDGYLAHQVVFGGTVLQQDVAFDAIDDGDGLDGAVPIALFTSRYTEMDFTAGHIRMQLNGTADHTGFRPLRCYRRRNNGPFIAECEVDGIKARLLVDTGNATTLSLNADFVRARGLWEGHPRFLPSTYRGITGALGVGRTVKLKTLQIGGFRFEEPVVDLADPRVTTLSPDFDGLLGINMLRRFTLGFDAAASTIWMKPNEHLADPFPYDLSGLVGTFKDGVAVVTSASKGSPAEAAGLQPGDTIPALDSRAKFAAFAYSLLGDPGEVRSFEIERGAKRMPITLTLKDWL